MEDDKLDCISDYFDQNKMLLCRSSPGQLLGSETGQLEYCNKFLDRFTMKNGKNPKDAIVHDIEYHDMFSAQRRT